MKEKVLGILLMLPFLASAQSKQQVFVEQTPQRKCTLKLYNHVSASRTTADIAIKQYGKPLGTGIYSIKIWNPSIALNIRTKKGNQHEVELASAGINVLDNRNVVNTHTGYSFITHGNKIFETYIAARYEYIQTFLKRDARFIPSASIGVLPYFLRYNVIPYTTVTYPVKDNYIGTKVFLTARVNYNVSKRIYIDLNVPICLADMNANIYKEQNPAYPADMQSRTTANLAAIPSYFSARLGLGFRL